MAIVFLGADRLDPGLHVDLNSIAPRMYVGFAFKNHQVGALDWTQGVYSSDGGLFRIEQANGTWALVQLEDSVQLDSDTFSGPQRKAHPLDLKGLFGSEERLSQQGLRDIQGGEQPPEDLAERIGALIDRYVYFQGDTWQRDLVTAWIAGTYIYKVFSSYPFLMLTSTKPGSGKSRLLQVIERLAFNAEHPYGLTESSLVRFSAESACTLLVDEQEMLGRQAALGRNMIELFNARYESNGNYLMSAPSGKRGWKPQAFKLFGPTALAKLSEGGIPPAIDSRSLKILMQPIPEDVAPEVRRKQLRHLHLDQEWRATRDALYLWGIRRWHDVYQTYISEDEEFLIGANRQLDLWRVIMSVARHLSPDVYQSLLTRMNELPTRVESRDVQQVRALIGQLRDREEDHVRVKDFARQLPQDFSPDLRRGGQPLSRFLRSLKDELGIEVKTGSGNVNYIHL